MWLLWIKFLLNNSQPTPLLIKNGDITNINELVIQNCTSGADIERSKITLMDIWEFEGLGSNSWIQGGALYIHQSDVAISNSIFTSNQALIGASISIDWSVSSQWTNSLKNNTFAHNVASQKGGGVNYNVNRPVFENNTYMNNSALYGANIASYATRIINQETLSNEIIINGSASGIDYSGEIKMMLVDYDNQTMVLENSNILKVTSVTSNASIEGIDYAKFTEGVATFKDFSFVSKPGSENIKYSVTSSAIDNSKVALVQGSNDFSTKIYANLRFWKPGEIQTEEEKCRECSYGTYSFDWNSTVWKSWINNVNCNGATELIVDQGYWRNTTNSTKIVDCLREQSWLGGYAPQNLHPVNWAEGYGGYLWTECQIFNGTKFQPGSNFECSKCPSRIVNAIRVAGYQLLALIFLSGIIIVNIKKRKENELSILLRILTNYIQMVTAAITFNIKFPTSFNEIFSQTDKFSSADQTYFSFDCFIEDYQIKMFTPSNALFKLSLYIILPIVVLLVFMVGIFIFRIIMLFLNNKKYDVLRYIVISFISIVFLFHPTMIYQSLTVFQWANIDEGDRRMIMHMDYKWYSAEHLRWVLFTGIPMLVIWVLGMPIIAFIFLYKSRNNLEDPTVKKYLLILYQGLRKETFYWELVNTLRKFLILAFNAFLSTYSANYRIIGAIGKV